MGESHGCLGDGRRLLLEQLAQKVNALKVGLGTRISTISRAGATATVAAALSAQRGRF